MPIMNGEEFLTKIREDKIFNKVHVVICTTEDEKQTVVRIAKKGVNGYVSKPFTPEIV